MRRPWLLLAVSLVLPACDIYSSPVPLDEPTAATFDEAVLGTWLAPQEDASSGNAAAMEVTRFNEREYLLEWADSVTRHEDGVARVEAIEQRARAFVTQVDGVRFLNVQDLDEGTFTFARYAVVGDELRIRMIASGPEERGLHEKFAASADLKAAVRARVNDPLLYEESETVLRRPQRVAAPGTGTGPAAPR